MSIKVHIKKYTPKIFHSHIFFIKLFHRSANITKTKEKKSRRMKRYSNFAGIINHPFMITFSYLYFQILVHT